MVPKCTRSGDNILFYLAVFVITSFLFSGCASIQPGRHPARNSKKYFRAVPVLYREALMLVNGTEDTMPDYAAAIEKFKKFKSMRPRDPRAKEAHLWIQTLEKMHELKNIGLENITE